jgi:hypothetical protein
LANLLVTGGAGFIGGNFVHYWNAHRPEDAVIVLDALTYAGNRSTLEGSTSELVVGDIRDTTLVEQLLRERDITTIVHFAAESHVDRSITGPDAFIDTNILGTNSLLKAARAVWLAGSGQPHRFHHRPRLQQHQICIAADGDAVPGEPECLGAVDGHRTRIGNDMACAQGQRSLRHGGGAAVDVGAAQGYGSRGGLVQTDAAA